MAYAQMATITTGEVVTAAYLNVIKANWDATINATSSLVQDTILASSPADKRVIERNSSVGNGNLQWIVPFARLVGIDTSETTTTSGSMTTLATVTSISIPATSAVLIFYAYRKSHTSGNSSAAYQLEINSGGTTLSGASTVANTADENAVHWVFIGPRSTNYKRSVYSVHSETGAVGQIAAAPSADIADTITEVNAQGQVTAGTATIGAENLMVFELPVGA